MVQKTIARPAQRLLDYSTKRTPKQQANPYASHRGTNPSNLGQTWIQIAPRYTYTPVQQLALQHMNHTTLTHKLNHIFDNIGHKKSLDTLFQDATADTWTLATPNELRRLT